MNKPVSLICGHSACQACLKEQWKNMQKTCAICRKVFSLEQLKINVTLNALVKNVPVKCMNNDCKWVGRQEEMEDHFKSCPFLPLDCPNGCTFSHRRGNLEEHLVSCPYKQVPCQFCSKGISRFALQNHEKNCEEKPLPCPLECHERFPRSVN